MKKPKKWVQYNIDAQKISELSNAAKIPELLARVLVSRGIDNRDSVVDFLNPSIDKLHDPFLMKDMDIAAERILSARQNREKVAIYTDYDADGVVCASVLLEYFGHIGIDAQLYIPDRENEGYGISELGVETIKKWRSSLVVTADCGISALKEIDELVGSGIDVIVSDHHECPETLPNACAIINPCRADSKYPFRELAGAGVVFKLVQALCERTGEKDKFLEYIDLVSIGTICDVVPLTGENRIIAKFGLEELNKTSREGIKALVSNACIKGTRIEAYHIGYMLGPRLNAAGRLGSALKSVKLLVSKNRAEAERIAQELGQENTERQLKEKQIFDEAVINIEKNNLERDRVIIVSGIDWHPGVIGIAASRLTEKYYKPCIVLSEVGSKAKGSCRSIRGFNMYEALGKCSVLLENFGGHEMAAGLSIEKSNINKFRKMINEYADTKDESLFIQTIFTEGELSGEEINLENARLLKALEPYGCGNPVPHFFATDLRIYDIRAVGNGKHLKMKLIKNDKIVDAIGFNMADPSGGNYKNISIDAVYTLEINNWNDKESVQLKISDIKI
ncbi:MAG: single-stranded-DNA-specific exonuclease RecJ [Eubacteriales bacterium]|nr:single-stranded-DNA-specific exonuclease RecJ [Eubacteriales bacterium]